MQDPKMIECPTCYGDGEIHDEAWRSCTRPVSECCGGCGQMEQCPACGGSGEIEIDEEE